jgi:hypothetical protein
LLGLALALCILLALTALLLLAALLLVLSLAALAGPEHEHLATETIDHDFRGVAFDTLLILPLTSLELALDIHLRALIEVFTCYLSEVYYDKGWEKVDEYAQRLWSLVENKFL